MRSVKTQPELFPNTMVGFGALRRGMLSSMHNQPDAGSSSPDSAAQDLLKSKDSICPVAIVWWGFAAFFRIALFV